MTWLKNLKDWWWALTLLAGALLFVATLPKRLDSVEAGVSKAQEENQEQYRLLDRLTYIAEQNQQMQQQAANQPAPPPETSVIWEWDGDRCWECASDQETCWQEQTWTQCK